MPRFSTRRSSRRRIVRARRSSRRTAFQGRSGFSKRTSVRQAKPYTPGRTKVNARSMLGPSGAMPQVFNTTQRYVTNFELTANASGLIGNEVYFRLNDMYEVQPSGSPGVHQPLGWNEMRQFYINSVVWKVDFQVRLIYTSGNNPSNGVVLSLKPWTNNFNPSGLTLDVAAEQPNVIVLEAPTDDRQPVTKNLSINIADVLGMPSSAIFNAKEMFNQGNNKVADANVATMGVSVGNWNLDIANNAVRMVVTMTQHVRWMKASNVAPS